MKLPLIILLIMVLITIFSCGSDDPAATSSSSSSSMLGFSGLAVDSLPQVTNNSLSLMAPSGEITTGNITSYNSLSNFFEQECFMPGSDNFCPTGTDTSGGDTNPRKFTIMTLLGLIYHADMYSGTLRSTCAGTSGTFNASSYAANTGGGDPDKFILDYNSLLGCVQQDTSGDGTVYHAYSVAADGSYQATLTNRYRVPYNGSADPGQTDIFQVYVTLSSGTPTFLAFNFAGANTMYSRAILMVNLSNHKFAVKYYSHGATPQAVTAIGIGGIDRTTGTPNAGYFYTKFLEDNGTTTSWGCVNNADGAIQTNDTNCDTGSVPDSGATWASSNDVKTYLAMSATEATNLAAFLSLFADDSLLTSTNSPTNATVGGDPELNFPKTITAQ